MSFIFFVIDQMIFHQLYLSMGSSKSQPRPKKSEVLLLLLPPLESRDLQMLLCRLSTSRFCAILRRMLLRNGSGMLFSPFLFELELGLIAFIGRQFALKMFQITTL